MNQIMTPSEMTGQQIDKAVANYRAMLVKHSPNYQSAAVQKVLGSADFAKAQSIIFRDRVEVVSSLITRTAPVNRGRTAKEAMLATGRKPYLNETELAGIPIGSGDTVTMSFYRFGRRIAANKLDEGLAEVGLKLIFDPVGQAAINEADPDFADKYPNATPDDNACLAASCCFFG